MNKPSIAARFKSFFSGYGGGANNSSMWMGAASLPGSNYNYERAAGTLWENSAVMPCLAAIMRTFPEAPMQITREIEGKKRSIPTHPLAVLLDNPNPGYSAETLMQATLLSYHVDGNAYWRKLRSASGKTVQLWYVPHWQIAPQWSQDGSDYISHYLHTVDNHQERIPLEDIIHYRFGLNPNNYRLGLSPLRSVLREIAADNECSAYVTAILRNMGIPGAVISPSHPDHTLTPEQAEKLKQMWAAQFTGEGRGALLASSMGIKVERVGLSPEDMALDKIRQIPEARICAALGVPASLVGLSVGDQQKTYSNYSEAREAFYESNIIPTQAMFARELQRQLMPEFGNVSTDKIGWDYSDVRILQGDHDRKAARIEKLYKAGIINRAQALEMLDMPFGDADAQVYASARPTLEMAA